ncbi:hypothetical protein EV401DRAFT_1891500, partial [Pisolithus croceorrhizus]
MSAPQAFNITPRMIHLQLFHWFKQFAKGSILMDTALDNIEFALRSDFDSSEWMDLAYCIMMELGCWGDVEKVIKNLPLSDPGAEDAVPAPLVVQRAMELQGVSLTAMCAPALPFGASIRTASTSSPGTTHHRHLSSRGGVQRKCHKVSASIFIDMDVEEDEEGEEEGEEEEEEEKEEDEQEEGGSIRDTVEVARGQWRHSQGIVKAVDLIKASLDFMRLEDGIQINVPIMFSCKVKERFDYGLSKFIGHDVWVIGSNKKGTRAMLCSLGR